MESTYKMEVMLLWNDEEASLSEFADQNDISYFTAERMLALGILEWGDEGTALVWSEGLTRDEAVDAYKALLANKVRPRAQLGYVSPLPGEKT